MTSGEGRGGGHVTSGEGRGGHATSGEGRRRGGACD